MGFTKYARAIADGETRKRLHKIYIAKAVAATAFFAICIAIIVWANVTAEAAEDTIWQSGAALVLAWMVSAAVYLILRGKFMRAFKEVLKNGGAAEENAPEVTAYREQLAAETNTEKKRTRPALFVLIVSVVVMIALIAAETSKSESGEFGVLSKIGTAVFAGGLLTYFFATYFASLKKSQERAKDGAALTAAEKKIDETQGRKYRYDVYNDRNLQNYRYLFPDENLRKITEENQKKHIKTTVAVTVVALVVALIALFVVRLAVEESERFTGYAYPVICLFAVAAVAAGAAFPYARRIKQAEKAQKRIFEQDGADGGENKYEKNYAIFQAYEKFSRVKGKTVYFAFALSEIVAFFLAVVYPDKMYSVAAFIILLFGLLLQNKFVAWLRLAVRPIEEEIDAETTVQKSKETNETETALEEENRVSADEGADNAGGGTPEE